MAAQQGLAFLSGGEAQEALADPAQPQEISNANTSSAQHAGHDNHDSGGQSFEALSRLSSQRLPDKIGGGTSRQALYALKVAISFLILHRLLCCDWLVLPVVAVQFSFRDC